MNSEAAPPSKRSMFALFRSPRPLRSDLWLIAGAPLVWLLLYNSRFWRDVAAAMWRDSLSGALFLFALFVLTWFVQSLLLVWAPRRLLRVIVSVLFLLASLVAHFTGEFGTLMDTDMMRNVFATDMAEVRGLLDGSLIAHVLLLGVLPCVLLWRLRWAPMPALRRWRQRAAYIAILLAAAAVGVVSVSASFATFFREYKPLRYLLNPAAPVYSLVRYAVKTKRPDPRVAAVIGAPFTRVTYAQSSKPKLFFLVIGETARRANFQLQGYPRATNPELSKVTDLMYFDNATSCGTATAVSLPCIFSHLERREFDADKAGETTNLLDMLVAGGVHVEWLDANSGCKGVCARVAHTQFSGDRAEDPLCRRAYCFDEVMLRDLDARLARFDRDTVIVFHQAGSHGPAYAQRYPERFDVFEPACNSNQLDECSTQAVINAYDNSILYTDYNLAQQIEALRRVADRFDAALLYASDHGESLGENGVYLHGMPYAFAPDQQKQVPMLLWLSDGFAKSDAVDANCVRARVHEPVSHDNIFHTMLGAMGVGTSLYRKSLDLLAPCRQQGAR